MREVKDTFKVIADFQDYADERVEILIVPSYHGFDAQGYAAVYELVNKNRSQGLKTILIDLRDVDRYDNEDTRRALARRLTTPSSTYARNKFWRQVIALGAGVIRPTSSDGPDESRLLSDLLNCREANDLLLIEIDNEILGQSLFSWLTTYVAKDSAPSLDGFRKALKQQVQAYLAVRDSVSQLIESLHLVEQIVVWNGRFPSWAGAVSAARNCRVELRFLENGLGATPSYTYSRISPQDFVATQESNIEEFDNLTPDQRMELSDYLARRRYDPTANQFVQGRGVAAESVDGETENVAIFTSSNDEVINLFLGRKGYWDSQEEGISAVSDYLSSAGQRVTLRVHPNLLSKSWGEYNRVRRFAASIPATVVGPASSISSYDLLANSTLVIVWASTIGAEAIHLGVPTVLLRESGYSRMADITIVRDSRDLPLLTKPKQVDPDSVLPYLFTLWRGGQLITDSNAYQLWKELRRIDRFNHLIYRALYGFDILMPWKSPSHVLGLLSLLLGRKTAMRLIDRQWLPKDRD